MNIKQLVLKMDKTELKIVYTIGAETHTVVSEDPAAPELYESVASLRDDVIAAMGLPESELSEKIVVIGFDLDGDKSAYRIIAYNATMTPYRVKVPSLGVESSAHRRIEVAAHHAAEFVRGVCAQQSIFGQEDLRLCDK